MQRKRSSEHEEASSPKRPHEAESGISVTGPVQSPGRVDNGGPGQGGEYTDHHLPLEHGVLKVPHQYG